MCTGFWFGPSTTIDGSVLFGRSEDHEPRWRKTLRVVPAADHGPDEVYSNGAEDDASGEPYGFSVPMAAHTFRHTCLADSRHHYDAERLDSVPFGEVGVNEHGLACSATVTLVNLVDVSDEQLAHLEKVSPADAERVRAARAMDPVTPEGVGEFNYCSMVLGECRDARSAVTYLGDLVTRQGTNHSNSLTLSDGRETWCFRTYTGHGWVAVRLGAESVGLDPNMGSLVIDPADLDRGTDDLLVSPGLVEMAREAGLLRTLPDGTIDVAATFGCFGFEDSGSLSRWVMGTEMLAPSRAGTSGALWNPARDRAVTSIDPQPLTYPPDHPGLGLTDAFDLMACRGRGTVLDADEHPFHRGMRGWWQNFGVYPIGNRNQVETHVLQLREDLPPVMWLGLARAPWSVWIPCFASLITEVPAVLGDGPVTHGAELASDPIAPEASYDDPASLAAFAAGELPAPLDLILTDVADLTAVALSGGQHSITKPVDLYLDSLQQDIISFQESIEDLVASGELTLTSDMANRLLDLLATEVAWKLQVLLAELREALAPVSITEDDIPDWAPSGLKDRLGQGSFLAGVLHDLRYDLA